MEALTTYIPYIIGIVVMPILSALKLTRLGEFLPVEHQKLILSLLAVGGLALLLAVPIDIKMLIDETLKAVGTGSALFAVTKYKRRYMGK